MDTELFYIGIYVGMAFMQFLRANRMRAKNRPYMLAYALYMLTTSMILLAEFWLCTQFLVPFDSPVIVGMDHLMFPLFYLEVLCLTNQDVNNLKWPSRWLQTFVAAVPVIGMLAYVVVAGISDGDELDDWVVWLYIIYIAGFTVACVYRLVKYDRLLRNAKVRERKEVKWVFIIMVLKFSQYLLYYLYDDLPSPVIYYALTYCIVLQHGYYVFRQMPANTRRLQELSERQHKEQQEALEDLKDATDGLKRRIDMDTALKAYRVTYPGFEARLHEKAVSRLTRRDLYLSALIAEGRKVPEIAEILAISPASVEVARHRLRHKLAMGKGENMNNLLRELVGETPDRNEIL